MRRLSVVFVAAFAVVGAAGASASGRGDSVHVIVCPLTAMCCPPLVQPDSIPCCPGPVQPDPIPCCPGPVQPVCQPFLSISASPDPMTAAEKVTISGALTHSTATAVTVQLWQRVAGEGAFSKHGTATTDASGSWSITIPAGKVMTNRWWYATASGLRSATIAETVSADVTLRAGAATLSGSVEPAHPGARVQLQRRTGAKWVTIARTRLTRHSAFSFPRAGLHGTVRVLVSADKENALSVSKQLVLS